MTQIPGKRTLIASSSIGETTIVSGIGDFARIGSVGLPQQLLLAHALSGPAQLPLFQEEQLDPAIVAEHYTWSDPPPVSAYAIADHVLGSGGLLRKGDTLSLPSDCFPPYFKGLHDQGKFAASWVGSVHLQDASEIIVEQPCSCPLHPNLVYGHFLYEVVPRLYVLQLLRDMGVEFRVALPRNLPDWVERLTRLYFAEDVLSYDPKTEVVRAPIFIVPSMMHTGASHIHPLFNVAAKDLMLRAGVLPTTAAADGEYNRIYLTRSRAAVSWHRIENEEEVENTLRDLGFAVVHPQELTLAEQLRVYNSADVICAEYSSALHNSMFSRPGTQIIALNRINWYQSLLGRVLSQPLAFITPSDGQMRGWQLRALSEEPVNFDIDCKVLREQVAAILNSSRG